MALVAMDRRAPLLHRLAYRLTVRGSPGSVPAWGLVERMRPLPAEATMLVGGQPLPVDMSDRTTSVNIYRGFYERAELAVLERLVRPGDNCVDVGANAGLYTLAMRLLSSPGGRVVAFEPNPVMADRVREVVAETAGSDVQVEETALGSTEGTATLHVFAGDSGLATLRDWNVDTTRAVEVAVRRLDDVSAVTGLGEIAFLKVDVESWEPQVLAGATRCFEELRVRAALIELATDASAPALARAIGHLGGYQHHLVHMVRGRSRWRPALRPIAIDEIATGAHVWSNLLLLRDDAVPDVRELIAR
jgi:FkbM family methyltransferase